MSKPVTNVEIEDVLSSIRKLVSSKEQSDSKTREAEPATEEKLLLTPSLRVEEAPEETDELSELIDEVQSLEGLGDAEKVDVDAEFEAEADVLSEAIADLDLSGPDEPEEGAAGSDEASERFVQDSRDEELSEDTLEAEEVDAERVENSAEDFSQIENDVFHIEEEPTDSTEAAYEDSVSQLDVPAASDEADEHPSEDLLKRAVDFENAVAQSGEEWEPDGTSDSENEGSALTERLPWIRDDAEDDSDEEEAAVDLSETEVSDVAEPKSAAAFVGFESRRRAPKDTIAAHKPAQDTPKPVSAPVAKTNSKPAVTDEDAVIDEEVLRDMVSEIVRQELQGALGERITRNVRKLVRREIHRALISKDFD